MDAPSSLAPFLAEVRAALSARTFAKLVLSRPRSRTGDAPNGVRARFIELRAEPTLSFVFSHATRDLTRNFAIDDGLAAVAALLDAQAMPSFAHATLQCHGGNDLQLLVSARGRATLRRVQRDAAVPASPPAADSHDRERSRHLPLELPFLAALGITDAQQRVVPSMARKWRQVDKFLEVLAGAIDALPALPAGEAPAPLRVVDYGSGMGTLTFAVHAYLARRFGSVPEVTGVELRPAQVDECNAIAERCGAAGLRFVAGDLRSVVPARVDVMIALHACDTATDHAIDLGLRAGARVIVCSPCCHKELRPQMSRPTALAGVLRHGIHLGQEAEMVTDSLRALLLEASGYDAKVFEFVSLEHTSKNKMILAIRRDGAVADNSERALAQVRDVKDFYGIREQCLETLIRKRAQACQTA
ncbi:MAG: SAM-dependent methyltransferase [Caldimonas sp.]